MEHHPEPESSLASPSRIDLLRLDVDIRMAPLWEEMGRVEEWNIDEVITYMRAAYAQGYYDALREPVRGQLTQDHGYNTPSRKS